MRRSDQPDLFASSAPAAPAPATDDGPRDLFGQPIAAQHAPAPRYRPRAPAQQTLDLTPGTFRLD